MKVQARAREPGAGAVLAGLHCKKLLAAVYISNILCISVVTTDKQL